MSIHGACDPRFNQLREEFERNFAERGDVGASVCVTVGGETVADLWGGIADRGTGAPWNEDTLAVTWSCTKGATALCAHMLADRGKLVFDSPVARYWPEFAQAGKQDISVRMLLNHQSGVAAIREPLPEGAYYDWGYIVRALERQEPFWAPGFQHGYHALTFGHLVGEVIRRISGKPVGAFFRDEIALPVGADYWIGLAEEHEARVAPNIAQDEPKEGDPLPPLMVKAMTEPGSLQSLVMVNNGGLLQPGECNTRRAHAAEIPAALGIGNARSLATMYRPLALDGSYNGVRLVRADAIPLMSRCESSGIDAVGLGQTRFGLGFMMPMDNRAQPPGNNESALLGEGAFGHVGYGGSTGFADPGARMSFGYVTNRQKSWAIMCDRGQALVDAAYRSIGWKLSDAAGLWYDPN